MLTKEETEVVEVPQTDSLMNMLLEQKVNHQKSLEPAPVAFANNGGVNDPPEGRG